MAIIIIYWKQGVSPGGPSMAAAVLPVHRKSDSKRLVGVALSPSIIRLSSLTFLTFARRLRHGVAL